MPIPEKIVEGLIAGSFGVAGTLITAAVSAVRDRDVATQRIHQLEEATKRLQFWDQWVRLANDLPLPLDDATMRKVQQEMNLLVRILDASSHSVETAMNVQRTESTAFTEKVHTLPLWRRWFLLYRPARSLAWFPRLFFYGGPILASVTLLAFADPSKTASVRDILWVELFFLTGTVIFRSLSEWLEKPRLKHEHPPAVAVAPQPSTSPPVAPTPRPPLAA